METPQLLSHEWQVLQNQHEQYERSALTIKITGMAVFVLGLAAGLSSELIAAVIVLFWVQEGIFKTFQNRLGKRLLDVEALIRQTAPQPEHAMQLHSEWSGKRLSGSSLVAEYLASTWRPTVTFPYVPMLLILAVLEISA